MRNNNELWVLAELAYHIGELAHIRIIEQGIPSSGMQNGPTDGVDGNQQRRRRQCPFTTT